MKNGSRANLLGQTLGHGTSDVKNMSLVNVLQENLAEGEELGSNGLLICNPKKW